MLGNEGDGFKIALSGIGRLSTKLGFVTERNLTTCAL